MRTEIATEQPHIVRKPGTCGGSPIIRGTRITVRLVATLWQGGDSVDDIVRNYPHLKPSWVHDAISFYLDHQPEIEQDIEANLIENALAEHGASMDEKGIVHFPTTEDKNGE